MSRETSKEVASIAGRLLHADLGKAVAIVDGLIDRGDMAYRDAIDLRFLREVLENAGSVAASTLSQAEHPADPCPETHFKVRARFPEYQHAWDVYLPKDWPDEGAATWDVTGFYGSSMQHLSAAVHARAQEPERKYVPEEVRFRTPEGEERHTVLLPAGFPVSSVLTWSGEYYHAVKHIHA